MNAAHRVVLSAALTLLFASPAAEAIEPAGGSPESPGATAPTTEERDASVQEAPAEPAAAVPVAAADTTPRQPE